MKRGFTLVEVLVGLVLLEIGILGVMGTLLLSSRDLNEASLLERAASEMEAVLDSLRLSGDPGAAGERRYSGGKVAWSPGHGAGELAVVVTDLVGDTVGRSLVRPGSR